MCSYISKEEGGFFMKMRKGKLLSVFLIYFLMLQGVLVHSSTEGHSVAAKTDVAFEESNFAATSEADKIAVDSDQYDVQIADNNLTVSPALSRKNTIVEGPSNSKVENDGDQHSGPGVATFILFLVVVAWLTTAGGQKEN
jgi:hypothetical protein